MKKYDVILFDIDQTLFDFHHAEEEALEYAFNHFNIEYHDEMLQLYLQINSRMWAQFERGEITESELRINRVRELFDNKDMGFDWMDFNDAFLDGVAACPKLIYGAEEVCRELLANGKELYIITNGTGYVQRSRLANSALKDSFKEVFISADIGAMKPSAAFFNHVLERVPYEKDRMLVVGDSLTADIAGAIGAGIDSCWVNLSNKKNNTEFIPNYEITTLPELLNHIK